tara:strand:- start:1526 stop:2476 length:951 start_codon:yes stop_codon:yes gene_type:complete
MDETGFNRKAYNILKEEEQIALNLQLVAGKSSWDAGQIIKKSHYKYLEIKARAIKFLEIFTIHYNLFNRLVPEGVRLNPDVEIFLVEVIQGRKKISEAVSKIDNRSFLVSNIRNRYLRTEMDKLYSSSDSESIALYNLIRDFDRFNNFRILPKDMQEPSAFKRRNKNIHKKHIAEALKMSEEDRQYIIDCFQTTKAKTRLYAYLIIDAEIQLYKIIEVKDSEGVIAWFTKRDLYLFRNATKINEFCRLIVEFYSRDNKHCTDGQKFWPMYRDFIKYAINYQEINQISFERGVEYLHEDYDKKRLPRAKKEFGQDKP